MLQHELMAKLPSVLSIDDLPLAELCAARIDGELIALDEAWAPVDEPDLPALRAAAIALRAPRALVIERYSAAWVHGALPAPPPIAQFCVPRSSRVAVITAPRVVVREVALAEIDIVDFAHARCTSLVRTGFDLLREPGHADARPERVVTELCAERAGLFDELGARLALAARMPHRAIALERLDRVETSLRERRETVAAQPSLTR
ncbi:hypothetical protein DCE94_07710 [Agromyces badenianii]|nr:hypothetical protein DCE94_07710 [Agromyces badenianii]